MGFKGRPPIAEEQNDYNATTYIQQYYARRVWPGKAILSTRTNSWTGSKTVHVVAKAVGDYSGIGTVKIKCTQLLRPSYQASTVTFNGMGKSFTLIGPEPGSLSHTFDEVSRSVETNIDPGTRQNHYTFEFNAPVGVYTLSWNYSESAGFWDYSGATSMYAGLWNKGQTDIPADAPIRIWKSDFSALEPISGKGFLATYANTARAGWEEV
jgi:hypothetical protein